MTTITVRAFTSDFVDQLNANFAAIDSTLASLPSALGVASATSLALNGTLAGNATFSVDGYAYIGPDTAQDPTYLSSINIASITKANPGVVTTAAAHGLTTGQKVTFTMPSGMTELNGVTAAVTVLSSTTYSIGINTSAYSTYTDYATNHGRAAPAGTNLAEVSGLTIRNDTLGGGGIVIRNRLYTGLMYQNFANDAGDIEGGFQQNGTGNSSLAGSRAFNVYFNYGDLGFYTQIQGTPQQVMRIRGYGAGGSEGYVSISKAITAPNYNLTVGSKDTGTNATFGVVRSDQAYGVVITQTAATGHNTIGTIGAGNLAISAGGTLSLTAPALGTPVSGTLTNCTSLPIATGISGLGTGIATALAVNTGSAGAPVLFNGALGTPTSGTLTNCSGFPGATSGNSTTHLGADVNLAVAANYYDGANTGSIGANGQVWLIWAKFCVTDTGGANRITCLIHNGTSYITETCVSVTTANQVVNIDLPIIVTLTGATTFTQRVRGLDTTTGVIKSTSFAQQMGNKCSSITAIRIA